MNPGRIVIGFLAAPMATTLLLMAWFAVGSGSFQLAEFPAVFLLYGVPPLLGASISWMPFVLRRQASEVSRGLCVGAGALSGLVAAAVVSAVSAGLFQPYLTYTIIGALSALIFREIALTGAETI
jgi:hypothetical protein